MDTHDEDPTCVIKMLDDFRCNSAAGGFGRRLSALTFPRLGGPSNSQHGSFIDPPTHNIVGKPVKLTFNDTVLNETEFLCNKKRKILDDTPDSQKLTDDSIIASPWETRRIKAELIEARTQVSSLESRITQMQTIHKETLVLFEQEKKSLRQSLDKERNNTSELEQRLKTLRKREADTKQELSECQNNLRQEKATLEKKCQTLKQENISLKDKLSELDSASEEQTSQAAKKLTTADLKIEEIKEELLLAKQTLEELQQELKQKRSDVLLWEADKAKLSTLSRRVKDLEYEQESNQAAVNMAQAQQRKLIKMYELEKEVAALKEENKNVRQAISNKLYLEGVVADLRSRLLVLQEREQEIVNLKVELGVLQTRLHEWVELSKQILGQPATSPISLRQCIESLQQREVVLTSEKTQLESRLKSMNENKRESDAEAVVLRSQIERMKANLEQNNMVIRRLRKQNSLIIWERNDLREMVDSCQKEFTVTSSAALDMQQNNKVEALEKVLEGYRKRMEQLEADPGLVAARSAGGGGSSGSGEQFEKMKLEHDALLKEKETLLQKIEELKEQLEYRALKGDFDIRQNKILHLRMNPISEATSGHAMELEKCQAEVVKLKERVHLLQSGQSLDLTQAVDERVDYNVTKELKELKEKLQSSQRQNQKMKEVFKTTGQDFREAVNVLLGYKVDQLANKMYRLTSMYAEAPDEHLLFKMSQSGDMDLLGTEYSETLGDLIDAHLHQEHSIPMFLSNITIQSFHRQTLSISVMPQNNPETVQILSD